MDSRSASSIRVRRSPLALSVSLAALGLLASFSSTEVLAACTPGVPTNGVTVTCSGTDQRNFSSTASNLTVNVAYGDQVGSDGSGNPVMQLTGSNNTINSQGWINPSYIGLQTVLTTGLQVGNASTQNIAITNDTVARLSGTSANLGASLLDLKGMAVDAQAGAGGKVTLVNSGTIQSERILGASLLFADMPVVAVYGGAQVEMTNMNEVYGRIAFQASSQGNIFTNAGTLAGSVSLGAGGGSNRFNAIINSSVVSGGVTGSNAVTVDSNPNLVFAAPGIVDGGAGGFNTLALQNAIGGGAGTAGAGTIAAGTFVNFSNLLVQAGTWQVSGALLSGAVTSTSLIGGSLSVNNDAVFGSGDVSVSSANLTTHTATVNLANNFLIGSGGMALSGTNTIVLNGVISGVGGGRLTKSNGGILRINGVNTYAGGTTLNGGTTVVSTDQAFGTGAIAIGSTGARIDASGTVNLTNDIGLSANGTFGGTGNLTVSGVISNTTSRTVAKVGSGQLILANANTYQGGTTLSGGTLVVGNNQALGSGTLTVASASTLASSQAVTLANTVSLASNLTVAGANDLRLNGVIGSTGAFKLIKTGSGNLTLAAANTFTGGIDLNGGTLTLATNSGVLGSGTLTVTGNSRLAFDVPLNTSTPIVINSGTTLDLGVNQDVLLFSAFSGGGNLTKTGTAEVTLFQTGSLGGQVDIQAGKLTALASNALGSGVPVNIASGATLNLAADTALGALTGSGQLQVTSGAISLGNGNATSTFSGAITGSTSSGMSKVGSGTLTLAGVNPFTSSLVVSAGRLHLNSTASLASSNVSVLNGATVSGTGSFGGSVSINNGAHLVVSSGGTLSAGSLNLAAGSTVDVALGAPSLTPLVSVSNNLTLQSTQFSFSSLASIDNGVYRLFNYGGSLNNLGASISALPTDFLPGEITLQYVAGGVNAIVNSLSLATQYWDGTGPLGDGVVNGGSGLWDSASTNWTKASGIPVGTWNSVAAVFQGTAGQVTLEGTQSTGSLLFKTDGYSLSSGTAGVLNLVNGSGGSATVGAEAGVSALLNAQIGGTGKLEKTGAGTLILAGDNLYSGGTTLTTGTLIVRRDTALGGGALTLGSGTTLRSDTSDVTLSNNVTLGGASNVVVDSGINLNLAGALSGAGGLVKIGAGSLALSGGNAQLGNTWLNAGGLVLGSHSALGSGTLNTLDNTTLDSGLAGVQIGNSLAMSGNLTFLGSLDMALSGVVSGTGNLIKSGNSALSLTGANTLNGTVTLNQGTLRLGHASSLGNASLTVAGASTLESTANLSVANNVTLNRQLTVSGSNALALSGVVSGTAGLLKDGSGTLTLSGNNTYQGGITLSAGTLAVGHAQALGTGRVDVTGSASLQSTSALTVGNALDISGALTVQGNSDLTLSGAVSGAGSLTKTGSGVLSLEGISTLQGTYNIDGGTLAARFSSSLGTPAAINVGAAGTLRLAFGGRTGALNGAGNVNLVSGMLRVNEGNFSGAMSGSGSLQKDGTGTLLLSGNSNFSGNTTVSAGLLRVTGSFGNGDGLLLVHDGGAVTGTGAVNADVTIASNGHLALASGSTLTLDSLVLHDTGFIDAALGSATPGAAGLANITGNLTLDGKLNITDTGGFGIGVYRLFDYGGVLTNNGLILGTLPSGTPTNELALQTSVAHQINLVVGGAADIRFWDGSGVAGDGIIAGGDGVWNGTNGNWTTTNAGYNQAWNDSFAVFQGAAGTVTVDGTQSVTGLQFINDYTLAGGAAGQLQLVNGIDGYSAVRVGSGKTATLDVSLTGNGILTKLDNGTLVLNGSNSHTDGTRLEGGTLVLGNDDALGSGNLTTSAGTRLDTNKAVSLVNDVVLDGALTLAGSNDLTLNGLVFGNGSLVKNGSATLTLNNVNDYAGTTLNGGTLVLGDRGALGNGQLTVSGVSTLDNSVAMTLGNVINLGSRLTIAGNRDLDLSGALKGTGTLVKQGSATLALTGSSNFLGTYQVDAGQLNLLGSNGTNAPWVTVGAAGILGVGADSTLQSLGGQGAVQVYNNSVLTLRNGTFAGSITGNGGLNIDFGSVALTGTSNLNGATAVSSGSLYVDGSLTTSSLSVAGGATLGGTGSVNGAVTIADGAYLQLDSTATLTTGELTLNNDSHLDAWLGAAVAGSASMLKVNGDLLLDGTLDISDAGGFGLGVYRLIDYTGSLTDNGLSIGMIPAGLVSGDLEVQTSVANQVNLLVGGAPGSVLFWSGSNGTWGNTASNWTNATGNFSQTWQDGFAVFQGTAGTVTVEGTQTTTGLQFASDGYQLVAGTAGELNLVNGSTGYAGVRVGSGNTATVDVNVTGSATLNKLEGGTLVLNGNNSYSGGTLLNGGILVVGSNSALGSGTLTTANLTTLDSNRAVSLGNAVTLGGGLILAGSNDLILTGNIGGSGALAKNGNANLTLSGNNSYSGGTVLNAGSLTLGHNAALGTGALTILGNTRLDTTANLQLNNAIVVGQQLTLTGSHDLTLGGVLSGTGDLVKNGSGQLRLTGNSSYTGTTLVYAGGLTVDGSFASANVLVGSGASLGGSGHLSGGVRLADGANLNVASATAPLTVGSLSLASNSNVNFTLGAPDTATTLVKVNGDLDLNGTLNITDGGNFGIGVYQLFSYGGVLVDDGMTLGSLPAGFDLAQMTLQTSLANQVNLVVDEGDGDLLFWNGTKTNADGTIGGGSGTWGADTNWTNSSGKNSNGWSGGQFAVFGGQSGTVTVSGQRVFSGIQFLSSGYQLVGGPGDSLEAVNAADGSLAAVRVANGATARIGAALVGEGGLEKLDGGTLELTGANTYSGGTQISAGTLLGNITSLQGSIVNDASLIFQQDVDGSFAGNLSGTGKAFKRGYGTLLFTGYNGFSGIFTVEDGVLQVGETAEEEPAPVVASFARMALFSVPVGDTLAADITVNNGAGLTGTGTVGSVVNHGTVQPGANGNLTVSGNFTNASDGTLSINLTPLPTRYLAVGGTATLAGQLNVFAVAPYTGDTTYTLLTADGGITGTFDSDNIDSLGQASSLAFIDTTLQYGANDVSLSVARNNVAFADVALSDNQRGVAAALDSAAAPASLRSAITSLDVASAQAAFDSLSGEIHASTASVLLEDSRYVRTTVNDRMRQGDCGNGDPRSVLAPSSGQQSSSGCQGQGVGWITALGGWANHDGGSGVAAVDRDLSGFMLGFDNNLNDQWRAGIAAGYTKTSLDANKRGSDASVDSYHLATYLSYQLDAFAARVGAGYSWHDIDTKRHVAAGSYNEELKAKYKAGTAQVFGEVGYTLEAAGVALEPFAGLAYVNYDSDTGREKGGAGALEASSKQNATFSTVGLRAGKQFVLDNGTTVTPRGSVGWRHAFGDTKPDADLRFVDGGAAFSTQGVPLAKDAAVIEAGLDVSVGAAGKLGVGYSGQLASDNRDHAVTVSFSMGF